MMSNFVINYVLLSPNTVTG